MARTFKIINFRINISKLVAAHYWTNPKNGEISADFKMLLDEAGEKKTFEGKEYIDNGFVSQLVNKETYEAEKQKPNAEKTNLPILGNVRIYTKGGSADSMPGYNGPSAASGVPGVGTPVTDAEAAAVKNKLPF